MSDSPFNSTASYCLLQYFVTANLGKASVKFRHAASLLRQEQGVVLRIGRGKTSVNGSIVSVGTVFTILY